MSASSTIYDVKIKYALDDKASQGIKGIGAASDKASNSASTLRNALAAIGAGALLMKGKTMLVDFNSEMDQMKIGMTAVMQMQLKMPFEKAKLEADGLFKTLQEMAKKSPATTKDFMSMASAIAPVAALMGGGPEQIAKLAQGGVLASAAFGEQAEMVALDIKQLLMGKIGGKDRIAQQLIAAKGIKQNDWNDDSKFGGGKRGAMVQEMLQDPALLKAADRMGESWAGQISTIKDQLEITMGEVGLPLMQAMTSEVKKWNTWISEHPKLIKEYVTSFGAMIKDAFGFIKGVTSWLVDNKDLLFSIGKTFLIFKGAQIGTNLVKTFAEGIAKMGASLTTGAGTIKGLFSGEGGIGGSFKGLIGILKGAGGVIPVLGLFIGALDIAATLLNTHSAQDKKNRENAIGLNESVGDLPGLLSRNKSLRSAFGMASDEQRERIQTELNSNMSKLGPEQIGLTMRKLSDFSEKNGGVSLKDLNNDTDGLMSRRLIGMLPDTYSHDSVEANKKIMEGVGSLIDAFQNMSLKDRQEAMKYMAPEQYGMPTPKETAAPGQAWKSGNGDTKINVTINKVEVASEDPDRFVFGLVQIADQAVKHKTQSKHAMSGGM